MTQYNTLKVKRSNLELSKLKSGIKDGTNVVGSSSDETNTQVPRLRKVFSNGLLANIKFSKTQLSKMIQSGGYIPGSFLLNPRKSIR